jgi:hypothetical protein
MRMLISLSSALLLLQLAATRDLFIQVPQSRTAVMVDGFFSEGEWKSAARIEVPNVAELYFQESSEFVYIAVRYKNAPSGIVDLYLSPGDGQIYDLHASAKLGERQLHGTTFSEWQWWNNHEWIANTSRVDSFDKRSFLPSPIREYQIRRSRFASDTWRLRFELTTMTTNNATQPVAIFPSASGAGRNGGEVRAGAGDREHRVPRRGRVPHRAATRSVRRGVFPLPDVPSSRTGAGAARDARTAQAGRNSGVRGLRPAERRLRASVAGIQEVERDQRRNGPGVRSELVEYRAEAAATVSGSGDDVATSHDAAECVLTWRREVPVGTHARRGPSGYRGARRDDERGA